MRRKLLAKLRITRPLPVTRQAAALLGIIAILFAWHHHAHSLPLPELSAVGSVVVAGGDPVLPSADDDCQICFALGHHPATAVDFFAAHSADLEPLPLLSAAAVPHFLPFYLLFRSRAPPRA